MQWREAITGVDGRAELPGSYVARRLAAAYTIYFPLWAGSLALGGNLIAAAARLREQGLYLALIAVPALLTAAAVLYTALLTLREAQTSLSFNRFSRHVFVQAIVLVGTLIVTLAWHVAFNPALFQPGN
jgi:hypothetical protein